MKKAAILTGLLALAISIPVRIAAQEKQAPPPPPPPNKITPMKVDVVVSEYDGAKKVANLPYTLHVNADDPGRMSQSQVRVGLRVPVSTGVNQFTYMDIGTGVDCRAISSPDGRYRLELSIDRSYLYTPGQGEQEKPASIGGERVSLSSGNPIVARFNSSYDLYLKDGQTIEATSTTDPISGRVLKISVTVNIVK